MKKRKILLRCIVPTGQQTAKAVQLCMCPFHDEASPFEARFHFERFGFFPSETNMGDDVEVL